MGRLSGDALDRPYSLPGHTEPWKGYTQSVIWLHQASIQREEWTMTDQSTIAKVTAALEAFKAFLDPSIREGVQLTPDFRRLPQ
jgi:hypothetical protein